MRVKGLLIILVVSLSIVSSSSIQVATTGKGSCIMTLDVCHASGLSEPFDSDIVVICEYPGEFHPLELLGFVEIPGYPAGQDALLFPLELPPKS